MRPSTELMRPSSKLLRPSTKLMRPSTKVIRPSAKLMRPTTKVTLPSTKVTRSSTRVMRPISKAMKVVVHHSWSFMNVLTMFHDSSVCCCVIIHWSVYFVLWVHWLCLNILITCSQVLSRSSTIPDHFFGLLRFAQSNCYSIPLIKLGL